MDMTFSEKIVNKKSITYKEKDKEGGIGPPDQELEGYMKRKKMGAARRCDDTSRKEAEELEKHRRKRRKRKGLKKRLKTRGHGTLSQTDIGEVKSIFESDLDIHDNTLKEFGMIGKLPKSRLLLKASRIKIPRNRGVLSQNFYLGEGKFDIKIRLNKFPFTIFDKIGSVVQFWLSDGFNNYSIWSQTVCLDRKNPIKKVSFEISRKDIASFLNCPAKLKVRVVSFSKFRRIPMTFSIYKSPTSSQLRGNRRGRFRNAPPKKLIGHLTTDTFVELSSGSQQQHSASDFDLT